MSQGSSVAGFRAALVTALQARAGLSGVQVVDGFPGGGDADAMQLESIWLGDANTQTVEIPVMRAGTKKVDEIYVQDVVVQVLKTEGETQAAANSRAVALLAELQQALAAQPDISTEIFEAQLVGWKFVTGQLPGQSGHGARFDCQVRVHARLI